MATADAGDADKSRGELLEELEGLRRQVAELAAGLVAPGDGGESPARRQREERRCLQASIEFIGDFDLVQASGVDVSSGGICFEIDRPLVFEMQVGVTGVAQRHRAELVWVRRLESGGFRLGLRFV